MMRTEEAVSASIWLANVGRLTRTAKINSDTAIERTVRTVLYLLRNRFLQIRCINFVMCPPRLLRWWKRALWFVRYPAWLRADKYTLVEPINGVDESLRAGVVRDHDDRLVKLAIELCKQEQDFFRRFGVQVAGRFIRHQNRRVGDNGTRDGDALLLPARKLPRIMVHAVCQTDRLKSGCDVSLAFGFAQMRQEQGQFDIFKCGQDGKQIVKLKHEANVPRAPCCQRAFVHRGNFLGTDHNAA